MNSREATISQLVAIYVALICLLALTATAALLPTGWWSTPLSLLVACVKIVLIAGYFMNLRNQTGLVRIFAGAGLFWLLIMIVLTSSDYFSRGWPG
jgi:cytochrome c oxidase subunit IV